MVSEKFCRMVRGILNTKKSGNFMILALSVAGLLVHVSIMAQLLFLCLSDAVAEGNFDKPKIRFQRNLQ